MRSGGGGEGGELASWGQEGEREERWLHKVRRGGGGGEGGEMAPWRGFQLGKYNLTEACLILFNAHPLFVCNQHFSYLGDKQYLYGDMVIILGFSFVSKSHVLCKVYC